ncbi:MAG: metallophosphoesterase family protein [Candidatus Heimdallarchaeota archaeon]
MSAKESEPITFTKDEEILLNLLEQTSRRFAREIRNYFRANKLRLQEKKKKRDKHFGSDKAKKKYEKKRLKLQLVPAVLGQALAKGLPVREPKRKTESNPELEQTIYEALDLVKHVEYDHLEEMPLDGLQFIPERLYLQRLDADNSKMLVKLYVDWGYLDENRLNLFLDEQNNEIADNIIIVIDELKKLVGVFPLRHISNYIEDIERSANSSFVGQITGLKPGANYYYRIKCINKETQQLFAATSYIKFRTAFNLDEVNKSFFMTVNSDLHAGRRGHFMRGKVKGVVVKGNLDLGRVFNSIAKTEQDVTFGEGYSVAVATGDLTDNASYAEYWSDLFKQCSVLWNHTPLLACIGNHDYYSGGRGRGRVTGGPDEDCRFWHRYITNPTNSPGSLIGHWFSMDFGNIHAVFLDSNGTGWGKYKLNCKSEQWHWLENDLKIWREKLLRGEKAPQFCFVFMHSAIMSLGFWGRGVNFGNDERVQTYLMPLFRKYGVDVAFSGHDHIYQRSKWLDTTYIQNGRYGGDARTYFPRKKKKIKYYLERICEYRYTRVYTTLYVPPNAKHFTKKQREEFDKYKEKMKMDLLSQPIADNYYFGVMRLNRQIGRLFDNNIPLKAKLINELIIPKLEDHVWLRSYAVEEIYRPKTREIMDMKFIPSNDLKDLDHYDVICPEKLVD